MPTAKASPTEPNPSSHRCGEGEKLALDLRLQFLQHEALNASIFARIDSRRESIRICDYLDLF